MSLHLHIGRREIAAINAIDALFQASAEQKHRLLLLLVKAINLQAACVSANCNVIDPILAEVNPRVYCFDRTCIQQLPLRISRL